MAHPDAPLFAACHGAGTPVVMLHCSSASHSMWGPLGLALAGEPVRAIAPDLHGHGRSPAWPQGERETLAVDAAAAWALLAGHEREVHLVGHSYGGAVAMQMALMQPSRVRSLTLYEPVPFGLLDPAEPALAPARREIEILAYRVARALDDDDDGQAAALFTNYWAGGDAWGAANLLQRERLVRRMPAVRRHFAALFAARWSAQQLQRLGMPVTLMHGTRTREPARVLAGLLEKALPRAAMVPVPGAGHLGPVSHAEVVAPYVAARLRRMIGAGPARRIAGSGAARRVDALAA